MYSYYRNSLLVHHFNRLGSSRSIATKAVRIGCASGFWGDTSVSTTQLVHKGDINYLVSDYLSEITMSLLTAAKRKDSTKGYAPDFVSFAIGPQIEAIKKKNIRVLSNAGGTNPIACADALQKEAEKVGKTLDIAVIIGDDIMSLHSALLEVGKTKEMGSGKSLPKSVMSMNAYFGAKPITKALEMGAEVVITGRCVDSALVLGPLMYEFDWSSNDYNKLASGSLAGHLLECGAQSTGGIFTDWQTVPDWDNIGFPIAECHHNGQFFLTKPKSTGGLVTPPTVSEQLVYEIGDPSAYVLPDVTCDFSIIVRHLSSWIHPFTTLVYQCYSKLQTIGEQPIFGLIIQAGQTFCFVRETKDGTIISNMACGMLLSAKFATTRKYHYPLVHGCVEKPDAWAEMIETHPFGNVQMSQKADSSVMVEGAKGFAPTPDYKICATYLDGFRTTAVFSVGGKRAIAKGRRTAESILKRVRSMFSVLGISDFKRVHIQAFGDESLYGNNARKYGEDSEGPRETVIWLAVEHYDERALEIFSRELAAAGTGMAPGLCGIVGGRPKVSPVLKLFSFLHPKSDLPASIYFNGKETTVSQDIMEPPQSAPPIEAPPTEVETGSYSFLLEELAYTRSGDKGNNANIGVVARRPSYVPYLRKHLTSEAVYQYFKHLFPSDSQATFVERFELPGINGFNFVMKDVLGGGGVASLRTDPQGKAFGQMLLDIEIKGVPDLKKLH